MAWAKDKDGHWALAYTGTISFISNNNLVKDAPKTLKEETLEIIYDHSVTNSFQPQTSHTLSTNTFFTKKFKNGTAIVLNDESKYT